MEVNNRLLLQWGFLKNKTNGDTITYTRSFSTLPKTLITLHYGVSTDSQRVSAWVYGTKNSSFQLGAGFITNDWYFFYVAIGY